MEPVAEASWNDWVDAYELAYEQPERIATLRCPRCRRTSLNMAFWKGPGDSNRGHAAFWCGACLVGIAGLRLTIPTRLLPYVVENVSDNFRLVAPA
jgi:hypothetical protein